MLKNPYFYLFLLSLSLPLAVFSTLRKKKQLFLYSLVPLCISMVLLITFFLFGDWKPQWIHLYFLLAGLVLFTLAAWQPPVYLIYTIFFVLASFYYQPYIRWQMNPVPWEILCSEQEYSLEMNNSLEKYSFQLEEGLILPSIVGYQTHEMLFFLPPHKEIITGLVNGLPLDEMQMPPVEEFNLLGITQYSRELEPLHWGKYYRYYINIEDSRYQISNK